jgi:hypothetical protein
VKYPYASPILFTSPETQSESRVMTPAHVPTLPSHFYFIPNECRTYSSLVLTLRISANIALVARQLLVPAELQRCVATSVLGRQWSICSRRQQFMFLYRICGKLPAAVLFLLHAQMDMHIGNEMVERIWKPFIKSDPRPCVSLG